MFELSKHWALDGSPRSNIGRYANHSCRPNAESDVIKYRKVIIKAIKTINPGDEITYDYGKEYFDGFITKRRCKCPKCTEWRAEQRKSRKHKKARGVKKAAAHKPMHAKKKAKRASL
jgi:SET domain-containing protein